MSNVEREMVLACKASKPYDALIKAYEKHYFNNNVEDKSEYYPHIASILSTICDKYLTVSPYDVVKELAPDKFWLYADESWRTKTSPDRQHWGMVAKVMSSIIRYKSSTDFGDMFT